MARGVRCKSCQDSSVVSLVRLACNQKSIITSLTFTFSSAKNSPYDASVQIGT